MKVLDPKPAAQVSERCRITGTPKPKWVVLVMCLWSFYSNRHGPGIRRSRSKKAKGGYIEVSPSETHRTARFMARCYVRELRVVKPGEVA